MGVTGLLPQLKPIQNTISLDSYRGKTVAIDSYSWLHKAATSCCVELSMGQPTGRYLSYFIKKIQMLQHFGVTPYFVFDGDAINVKGETNDQRRAKRVENRQKGHELMASNVAKAREYFLKAVDVTPEMAKTIMEYLTQQGIQYVVAPYEADPQMVYLEQQGIVQGIISEDSDLLVFGCESLLTKLNDHGECVEIKRSNFSRLPHFNVLSQEQLRMVVALSGCDYTSGVPGVGLITALKLIQKHGNMERCLQALLLEGKKKIPPQFKEEYTLANLAFQFQRVFDPKRNLITTLNPVNDEHPQWDIILTCIGNIWDNEIHQKIACGEINPFTKQPLASREVLIRSNSFNGTPSPQVSTPAKRSFTLDSYASERKRQATTKTVPKVPVTPKLSPMMQKKISMFKSSGTGSVSKFFNLPSKPEATPTKVPVVTKQPSVIVLKDEELQPEVSKVTLSDDIIVLDQPSRSLIEINSSDCVLSEDDEPAVPVCEPSVTSRTVRHNALAERNVNTVVVLKERSNQPPPSRRINLADYIYRK